MVKEKIMSIKLSIMSIWIPEFILIKELERTSYIINEHLDNLLGRYSISRTTTGKLLKGNLNERRARMAIGQNLRVEALIKALGFDKACELGRIEMFNAGYKLGREAQKRLGVGKNIQDTLIAAKILYKVLGINFTVETHNKNFILRVESCALASHYSPETCKIMSAADEGVLKGLNNNMSMKFIKRITEGSEECTACINIGD